MQKLKLFAVAGSDPIYCMYSKPKKKTFLFSGLCAFVTLQLCAFFFQAPVSAKQVKLTKSNVRQLVKLTLKLAQSLDEKNADMLADVSDPQLGVFFWNGGCGCVVPARHFSADENKKEIFFDDPPMTPFYDAASRQLSQGVAVLGKEKENPAKAVAESANVPFASIDVKDAQKHFFDIIYKDGKCSGGVKEQATEKKWMEEQSIVEIEMIQGFQLLYIFFRKQNGKLHIFHVISRTWCP